MSRKKRLKKGNQRIKIKDTPKNVARALFGLKSTRNNPAKRGNSVRDNSVQGNSDKKS